MPITMRPKAAATTLVTCGLLAACVWAQGASASDLLLTYKGTANAIIDPGGAFGLASDVTSASFTDQFIFDLDNPGRVTTPTYDELYGGSNFGTATPLVSSVLTINGRSISMNYVNAGQIYYGMLNQGIAAQAIIFGPDPNDFDNVVLLTDVPSSIDTPFSGTGSGFGYFGTDTTSGNLSPVSVTASLVPEPAGWIMMLTGVAGLGAAVRTSRRKAVGAASPV
jgi:hypothetical protein